MRLKPSQIKLNENNPRTIKDPKFNLLVKSLKEFPEMADVREVVVNKDHVILGGNMRFRAMVAAGWKDIPVRVVDWSEEKQMEFIAKDNIGFGDWDYDLLADQYDLDQLSDWGMDIPDDLRPEPETDEDEAPEVEDGEPDSKLGEVYQLGRHRLMCGDATKIEDVEKLMDGNKADMVFTDPPYGMNLDTNYTKMRPDTEASRKFQQAKGKTTNKKYSPVIGDDEEWIFDKADHFDCDEQFWWGADWYRRTLPRGGSWFVWDKRTNDDGSNLDSMFGSVFELCWSKTRHKREIARIKYASLFGTEREDIKKRLHPTQKPILLCSWFIERFSKEGWNIVDLFGGSGSTLIACEQTDRTCFMMELDPKYCDVIRKRYENFIEKNNK